MAIAPISQVALPSLPALTSVGSGTNAAAASQKEFSTMVVDAMENLESLQQDSDQLATQAATGDLQDVHEYMIASSEAGIATELTVAVRNKAVEAFNSIMQMGV